MPLVRVFIPGLPATQGSKRAFVQGGRAIITEDNKRLHPWRSDVQQAALSAMGDAPPIEGPIAMQLVFLLPRPKGHFNKSGRHRKGAPDYPATKPDLSKLVRAVEDALKGAVWRDDAQVVTAQTAKRYTATRPGVYVELEGVRDAS